MYDDGLKVAEFRRNVRDHDFTDFFLKSLGDFTNTPKNAILKNPSIESITYHNEYYRTSPNLNVSGSIITVKNTSSKFDGEYDITKLATNNCLSGDCIDGHGRKVLANVTNNIPHIRIMDGKFKNNVFLGDGDMLIDGETSLLDGTCEIGRVKGNYGNYDSKASFHPSGYNETIEVRFEGRYDPKYFICSFNPKSDDKKKDDLKWMKDIYSLNRRDLGYYVYSLTKESGEAYSRLENLEKAKTSSNNFSSEPPATTKTTGGKIERPTFKRTCGGTGKVYHNVTEYTTYDNNRVANSRQVSETCGTCHGRGPL